MRHICYVSGTRADFGLMRRTLDAVSRGNNLRLSIIATGMHLDERYGLTIRDIKAAGLPVAAEIRIESEGLATGVGMAHGISRMLEGVVDAFKRLRPDLILLLGDRGEMLAGAIAALHLNIPIAHVHGGERSGTIDESVRHAISKLSHFHFVATEQSRERLIRMGELSERTFVTGAPGLDGILQDASVSRTELLADLRLDSRQPISIFSFHPVVQEVGAVGVATSMVLEYLLRQGIQVVALKPNSDAGAAEICAALDRQAAHPALRVITHMPRHVFLSLMAVANLMVGNSSAGIIEAASFGLPVINVGSRQNLRERNANVFDVEPRADVLDEVLPRLLKQGRFPCVNVYGDGQASVRITELLRTLPLDNSILAKVNAY